MAEHNRDIIVIGASAGGVEALRRLIPDLPADLAAAVFVVLHMGSTSMLAGILERSARLPVEEAESGEPIKRGKVYVAQPDRHLMLHDGHVLLRRGPRENRSRPAIDPLFRSAAASFGGRVIGVVLSGSLNDGAAGLRAIKRCGGLVGVQEPTDAAVPTMPLEAMRAVEVDFVSPIAGMGARLAALAREAAGATPDIPIDIRLEAAIAAQELRGMEVEDRLGTPSRFTCPECHGALWEIPDGGLLRFRCHVGHAYTADSMLAAQSEEVDTLLGTLLRSHEERAALAHRMAENERAQERHSLADQLERRARDYEDDARVMSKLLMHGSGR